MGPLEDETLRLLEASMASSTHTTYMRGVGSFELFRKELGLNVEWPAPVHHIIAYIAHLSIEGKAPSTICTYVSAISYVHRMNGWSDPSDNFIVQKLKEGSRRRDKRPDSRRPISLPILRQLVLLLQGICGSTFESCLFKVAFLVAFFGYLRVGEFTVVSKSDTGDGILSIEDVTMGPGAPDSMEITIRFSKTNQQGKSVTLHFVKGTEALLCPVSAMADFLRIRPVKLGPLFIHFGGDPLTRYQFGSILKKGISAMGLSAAHFTPHSFRIGAATSAAISGVPIDTIKSMGRWQSSAVKLYIRPHRVLHIVPNL
jgi:hypothetical protein